MRFPAAARAVLRDSLVVYWALVKIIVPVLVLTRLGVELGVIETLSPLRAPARLLACRIAVQTRDRDAAACLDQLRRDHPTAAVAAEVLELRVQVAFDRGGCKAAAPFLSELVAAAPRRTLTTQWQRRCQEAPR